MTIPGTAGDGGCYVYLIRDGDGALYAGHTTEAAPEMIERNARGAAAPTDGHRPMTLLACRRFTYRAAALRVVAYVRRLSHETQLAVAGCWRERDAAG